MTVRISVRTFFTMAFACAVALATVFSGVAQAQEDDQAILTVFHAVPAEDGFPADVYLNGEQIIDGFVFETSSDSFNVDPGEAELWIFPAGSDPDVDDPAVETTVTIEAGVNYSVVAQISGGAPVITLYVNDVSAVDTGEARVTFRQTSAADALDIAIGESNSFDQLAATNEATFEIAAGETPVAIAAAGTSIFEQPVRVADGTLTVLYAVGTPGDESFDVLVQEVPLSQVLPASVPTGSGGDKAANPVAPFAALAGIFLIGVVTLRRTHKVQV